MEDNRNTIDRSQAMMSLINGRPETEAEMVSRFAKYSVRQRADALDALDLDMRADDLSIGQRAEQLTRRRRLGDVHEILRKAGR